MKTHARKNQKTQTNALVLFIYLFAFVLITWSFNTRAAVGVTADPELIIATNMGNIKIKLNSEKAPISTENFLKYVKNKHYEGTVFHRVIKDFMIQGGGFSADMKEKSTLPPIKNEAKNGLSNLRGSLAMARTNDVDSATAQFFINVVDNQRLDHIDDNRYGYAVFGEVTKGMEIVDKIRAVKTTTKGEYSDVPEVAIKIKTIKLINAVPAKSAKKTK